MGILRRMTFDRRVAVFSTALSAFFAFSGETKATIIAPGPGAFPPDIFSLSGTTLLASVTSPNVVALGGGFTSTVTAAVYSDPANVFGAGDLDFVYQITNSPSSADAIGRVTGVNFTGFSTDVGFVVNGGSLPGGLFVDGTVSPQLVDRVSADVVGFSFNAPSTNPISPGQTSTVLVIETNATNFTAGNVNLIDGDVSRVAAFQPTAIPEPASLTLLSIGIGFVAFAGVARKSR